MFWVYYSIVMTGVALFFIGRLKRERSNRKKEAIKLWHVIDEMSYINYIKQPTLPEREDVPYDWQDG